MNFLRTFLSISLTTLFFSCSSDDGGPTMTTDLSAVVGSYNLTQVNVSIAQDPNEDGTSSTNMVEELACLTGNLIIGVDSKWSLTLTGLNITPVTGDFYAVQCENSFSYSGSYIFQNNQLNLNDVNFETFTLNGTILTETKGDDLPGILSYVYAKQ